MGWFMMPEHRYEYTAMSTDMGIDTKSGSAGRGPRVDRSVSMCSGTSTGL
jgi:hypothetical protein